MSDIELSSDSEEFSSEGKDISPPLFDEKSKKDNIPSPKPEKVYDGVPDVSSSESGEKQESESSEKTTSEGSIVESSVKERNSMNHRSRGLKSLRQKLREKAFKKTELAGNDPALISHRMERRALADRLEEDSEFRKQYIDEQAEARKLAAEVEDEDLTSSMNYSNTSELINQVNKLQARRRGALISNSQSYHSYELDSDDEDATPESYEYSNSGTIYTYPTESSIPDDDDLVSLSTKKGKKTKKVKKVYKDRREAPAKAGIYIHIENLTLNL